MYTHNCITYRQTNGPTITVISLLEGGYFLTILSFSIFFHQTLSNKSLKLCILCWATILQNCQRSSAIVTNRQSLQLKFSTFHTVLSKKVDFSIAYRHQIFMLYNYSLWEGVNMILIPLAAWIGYPQKE